MGYCSWVKIEYYKGDVLVKTDYVDSCIFVKEDSKFQLPSGADSIVVKWRSEFHNSEDDFSSLESEEEEEEGEDVVGCVTYFNKRLDG